MGLKRFDRKFGAELLRELPAAPAVYLFKDDEGRVLYAGKAVNVRRRLQSYRNATRRKVHRKMRALVREASELEVRIQPSERAALLLENQLIRSLRPPYNVDGAFTFLYPAIGVAARDRRCLLCFTTRIPHYRDLRLRWHGVFRSRHRTRDAFEALVSLLARLGHREPRSRLPAPPLRGSSLVALRRVEDLVPGTLRLLAGECDGVLETLSLRLLDKPDARQEAEQVGEDLRRLRRFYARDVRPLRAALRAAGRRGCFVSQQQRDALFLARSDSA